MRTTKKILLAVLLGFALAACKKTEEVAQPKTADADTLISHALKDYPGIRYSFNPTTGKLLLLGHVLNSVDRAKIIETLQDFKFISQIDFSNVVIDELVWREINQVIAKNPAWRSTFHPGTVRHLANRHLDRSFNSRRTKANF